MFAGLPELGISNGDDLKETLTNCPDPLKAIDQFQVTTVFVVCWDKCSRLLIRFMHSSSHGMRTCLIRPISYYILQM